MAEGDSIRRLADRLHERAAGRRVERSVVRHARYAVADLGGADLPGVDAVGKHLLVHLSLGGRPVVVHSHLRMQGRWTVGIPPRTPAHRRRIELHLGARGDDPAIALVGTDLPVLHLGPAGAAHRWVGHLGPDLCGASFDAVEAVQRLRAGGGPLAGALLDQQRMAGIGNLYAVEVPFLVGLDPHRPVADVEGVADLVALSRALLTANVRLGAMSTTGSIGRGQLHWIYGRAGRPCPVCRSVVQLGEHTPWGRPTWWCPGCQRGEGVDLARARRLLRRHPGFRAGVAVPRSAQEADQQAEHQHDREADGDGLLGPAGAEHVHGRRPYPSRPPPGPPDVRSRA